MNHKICANCDYRVRMLGHVFCFPCYLEFGGYDFRPVKRSA